jgi:hypothetical protein
MSQNLINSLTDDVSALRADVSRLAREGRREAEWLNAIRLEIEARGTNANMETVLHYAQEPVRVTRARTTGARPA